MPAERLSRSAQDKMIAGVCGGIARYLDVDPVFVRLAFLLLLTASGVGLWLYILLTLIMPLEKPDTAGENAGNSWDGMTRHISTRLERLSNQTQGPTLIGGIMITLGLLLLLQNLGWLAGVLGAWFWPLLLIGFGAYLAKRRRR